MMGLLKKERLERFLSTLWENGLPNRIQDIGASAFALSQETGYLSVEYESDGWAQYVQGKKTNANKVF
jgi:hypothetical protein